MRPPNRIDVWADDFHGLGVAEVTTLPYMPVRKSDKTFLWRHALINLALAGLENLANTRSRMHYPSDLARHIMPYAQPELTVTMYLRPRSILSIRRRLSELAVVEMDRCEQPQLRVRFQDLQPQRLIGSKSLGKSPLLTLWKRQYAPVKRKRLRTRDGRSI